MAGDAVVGALRVVLGADTADLDKGLKSSQDKLAVFGDIAKASMAVVAAAVGAAAVAIGMSIKTAIDNADKVNKLSQSTGTTTEEFTKLSYAAELADVSQESLGKSLGKLSKAMVSAASDGAGPAGLAFQELGINVKNTDGTLKSSSDVISEVAGKFAGYQDGAAKTALAIALFGKAGAEMIPLLNLGKQGLADSADEAEKFGLVLDKKTTMAAEAFNDNLKKMDLIKQGIYNTISAKLLPSFEQLSEVMLEAKQNSSLLSGVADGLSAVMKGLVTVALSATVTVQRLGAELAALWQLVKAFGSGPFSDEWTKALANFNDQERQTNVALKELETTMGNLWKDVPEFNWQDQLSAVRGMNKEVQAIAGEWGKVAAPIIASENATKNALKTFLDSQAKRTAAQTAEAETIGMAAGALERLRVIKQGDEVLDQNKIARTPAVVASITSAADAAAAAALKIQAANISQMVMSPAEKYAQDMAQLQVVYQTTSMTAETFAARQQQLAEGVGATWNQAGAGMASGFAQLANQFGKSSKEMAIAGKAFGIIEATINTYTAFTKALASAPPPFNYALAAGTLAAGMAKVAAISSMSIPSGYATGGFVSGPGTGTSDSVPAMLSAGEFVMNAEATRQYGSELEAMNSGAGSRGSGKTIILNGFVWGRDQMRDMFDFLNEGLRDGHEFNLKFA